jgi:hypothetical protein
LGGSGIYLGPSLSQVKHKFEEEDGEASCCRLCDNFFVVLSLLMFFSSRMLADGATYSALVVGQQILRDHSSPNVYQYSHTEAGALWIAEEWLSQVLLYIAYARGGWFGVSLLTATTPASAYSLLFAWLCRRLKPVVALVMTVIAFSLRFGFPARPAGDFFLSPPRSPPRSLRCGLVDAVESKKAPWWLPLLVSLSANLHASFPIALVLPGLFGPEALASAALDERFRTGAKWALVLLAALLATGGDALWISATARLSQDRRSEGTRLYRRMESNSLRLERPLCHCLIAGSLAIVAAGRGGGTRAAPLVLRHHDDQTCQVLSSLRDRRGRRRDDSPRPAFLALRDKPPSVNPTTRQAAAVMLAVASLAAVLVLSLAARPVPSRRMAPSAALAASRVGTRIQ